MGTVDWESHVIGFIVLHNEKGETLHLNPKYIKFFGTFDNATIVDAHGFRFVAVDSVDSIIAQLNAVVES